MTEYKNYSLEQLDKWLYDCMSCDDITPQEIYDKIHDVVKGQHDYYELQKNRLHDLLGMLKGDGKSFVPPKGMELPEDHFERDMLIYSMMGKENTKKQSDDKVVHTYDDMIAMGYEMTADGFWFRECKQNSWNLIVEEDMASGDYYITLPKELLTKVNWKENDELEWRCQEDGTIKLSKVDVT